MIGLSVSANLLIMSLLLLGSVSLGGALGRGVIPRLSGGRGWPLVWLAGLVALGSLVDVIEIGWSWLALELLGLVWLAWGATVALEGPRARPALARMTLWFGLLALVVAYLRDRDLIVAGALSSDYLFVLHDLFGQLVLPAVSPFVTAASSDLVIHVLDAAVEGASASFFTALGLVSYLGALLIERLVTSRARPHFGSAAPLTPGREWDVVLIALLLVAVGAPVVVGTEAPVGLLWASFDAMLAVHVMAGIHLATALASRLRVRPLVPAMLVAALVFSRSVGLMLAIMGGCDRWLGMSGALDPASLRPPPRRVGGRQVLAAALLSFAVFAGLGLVSEGAVRARTSPEWTIDGLCAGVHATPTPDGRSVRYQGGGTAAFTIERGERRVGARSPEHDVTTAVEAAAACAATGLRLCRSDEWLVACACGHLSSLRGRRLRSIDVTHDLTARARRDCRGGEAADQTRCVSDDGVRDLLGGVTEILADEVIPGAHFIAGRNVALEEDAMSNCRYRGILTDAALRRHRWRFIGFRCCGAVDGVGD